jgi:hypothetical protein
MRGLDQRTGELFSYVEARVRADHPLRPIRSLVNEALVALEGKLAPSLHTDDWRVSEVRSAPPLAFANLVERARALKLLGWVNSHGITGFDPDRTWRSRACHRCSR